jgi:hypothetical protein
MVFSRAYATKVSGNISTNVCVYKTGGQKSARDPATNQCRPTCGRALGRNYDCIQLTKTSMETEKEGKENP